MGGMPQGMIPHMMPPHMMAQYGSMPPMMGAPMAPHQYMSMMPPPHGMMMNAPPRPLFPAAASANQKQAPPSQPKPTFPAYRFVLFHSLHRPRPQKNQNLNQIAI